jgi:transcriptional regulator with XRE-family HTH domain
MRQNGAMAKQPRTKTYLREWRKTKPGRTLEVVAAHLHMSQPQLGRIERGDQPYNQDLLEALAELYGCAVADLLMRDPTRPDNIWSIWDTARPGERRLIEAAAEAIVKTGTSG